MTVKEYFSLKEIQNISIGKLDFKSAVSRYTSIAYDILMYILWSFNECNGINKA